MKPQAFEACFLVAILAILFDQTPQMASGAVATSATRAHDKTQNGHEILINEQLDESNAINVLPQMFYLNKKHHNQNHIDNHYSASLSTKSNEKKPEIYVAEQQQPISKSNKFQEPKMIHATNKIDDERNKSRDQHQFKREQDGFASKQQLDQVLKSFNDLRARFVEQVIRQRVADKDHLLMEKWLVDNINDLHRELKQTEMDFDHYVKVTKNILAQNEQELRRQLARQTSLPLLVPIQTTAENNDYATQNMMRTTTQRLDATTTTNGQHLAHHFYLERLLLGHTAK